MVTVIGTVICGFIVMAATFWLAVVAVATWVDFQERRQRQRVLLNLHRADAELSSALKDAKQQMNDAAGQSWRNPFE